MKGILWAVLQEPLSLYPEMLNPLYSEGKPHHITLCYGAERSDFEQWIGCEFEAIGHKLFHNSRIQALAVRIPEHIPCWVIATHVTISYVPGVQPVEANNLLLDLAINSDTVRTTIAPRTLKCRIEFLEWQE